MPTCLQKYFHRIDETRITPSGLEEQSNYAVFNVGGGPGIGRDSPEQIAEDMVLNLQQYDDLIYYHCPGGLSREGAHSASVDAALARAPRIYVNRERVSVYGAISDDDVLLRLKKEVIRRLTSR